MPSRRFSIRGGYHIVTGLSTATEANNRVSLPASRQRINKMSFAAVAKAQPQHRSVTSCAHEAEGLPEQAFPPFARRRHSGIGGGQRWQMEQSRVVLDRVNRGADMLAIESVVG